ncbi:MULTISPECIES: GNAT family N-acetyltransferase [unclassified Nocardia]|uniref:GNAT family N-acetyltransferase n=1 Tax=unclassified Nocardia TaxID=2637762 RepID=UPI001CE4477D|nr:MULTISPECIES: GNAT family N-acetyltransferase [unclassified Nocardia]
MRIRDGGPGDIPAVLALGDEAVVWMNARGNTRQWGTSPWTGNERREAKIRRNAESGGMRIMEDGDGSVVGVLVVTETPQDYVPAVDERELYVNLLLTSRRHRGLGATLIDRAKTEAAQRGIDLIRVDCYAGGGGELVKVYENYGFSRVQEFTVGEWPGMLLALRLSEARL